MHGKVTIEIKGVLFPLWFNNYSQVELSKLILPEKDGFKAKHDEFALLNAIQRMSSDNYLSLMKEILWSGILGHAFATDSVQKVTRKELSELIATAPESQLYNVWSSFLSSMGVNLDGLEEKSNTKDLKKNLTTH